MLKKRFRRINWRSGNGELIGFVVALPLMVLIGIVIYTAFIFSVHNQQLTVATYSVGRAAVVSSSEELARSRATAVLKSIYGAENIAEDETTMPYNAWYEIKLEDTWNVGKFATITAYEHVPGSFPLPDMNLSCSVVMMIEDDMSNARRNR